MAEAGIPPGGKYPTKKSLRSIFGDSAGDLTIDRRTLYGKQANRLFTDSLTQSDLEQGFQGSGVYYSPEDGIYQGNVSDEELTELGYSAQSAFSRNENVEIDIPTSSTDYSRPRTVAAAYTPNAQNPNKGVMTVIFRDGVIYNYYEVSPSEWLAFHSSFSKGAPWLNKGFKDGKQQMDGLFIGKPRGPAAEMTALENEEGYVRPEIRAELYRVYRTAQQKMKPKIGRTWQNANLYTGQRDRQTLSGTTRVRNRVKSDRISHIPKDLNRTPSAKGNRKAS